MKKNLSQQGTVSIILAILILSQLLVIGLGISALMLRQIRMSGQAGLSVVAFYAAEAGAERCLYQTRCVTAEIPTAECQIETGPGLDQGCASVGGVISATLPDSTASYQASREEDTLITSIGRYVGTSRKVELTWPSP